MRTMPGYGRPMSIDQNYLSMTLVQYLDHLGRDKRSVNMRSLAFTEALFPLILFFGNGCLSNLQSESTQPNPLCPQNKQENEGQINNTRHSARDYEELTAFMSCNCSWGTVPSRQLRIVGGQIVDDDENYPMMVSLQYTWTGCSFCGGSILTEYHVLTAAHCVYDEDPSWLRLAVGVKTRCKKPSDGGQYIPVDTIYTHVYYNDAYHYNDIAIVLARRKITFSDTVGPTCVHSDPISSFAEPILILGWGSIEEDSRASDVLRKVFVNYVDARICKRKSSVGSHMDFNSVICTYADSKDSCKGDSGGPLLIVDTRMNRLSQIALVSIGFGCARYDTPAVNTALYPYLEWIKWIIMKSLQKYFPEGAPNDIRICET